MYDWANSAYVTIVMAAIFPIFFETTARAAGYSGDVLWGYATSAATLVIAVCAPFLGAIGDFKGMKMKLFSFFLFFSLVFTVVMALANNTILMLVGYAVSYVGYAGANLFYDSFITDVTTKERMDDVSAYGYVMGYIGGSTIPFLISIALVMFGENFGISADWAVRISVLLSCVWWGVFSIPMLRNVKQTYYVEKPKTALVREVFGSLKKTIVNIISDKKLRFFVIAYFFYIDGVGTIIHMATSYGSTLGLGTVGMILALLVTQIVAVPFSILFSKLAGKVGTVKMLLVGILIYCVVCIVGFYMGFSLEPHQATYEKAYQEEMALQRGTLSDEAFMALEKEGITVLSDSGRAALFTEKAEALATDKFSGEAAGLTAIAADMQTFLLDRDFSSFFDSALSFSGILFWILAILVGTAQGGVQALSRSFFGKIIPPEKSNEYFGFFDIFGKFAAVVGPGLYALFAHITGRSSIGILSLILLFVIGWLVLFAGRKHLSDI